MATKVKCTVEYKNSNGYWKYEDFNTLESALRFAKQKNGNVGKSYPRKQKGIFDFYKFGKNPKISSAVDEKYAQIVEDYLG